MNLQIDKELQGLIPPLSEAELKALEESVLHEGIRDAIVVWTQKPTAADAYCDCEEPNWNRELFGVADGLGPAYSEPSLMWKCETCGEWDHYSTPVIIDGHNRYSLLQKHDLEFETVEREFESKDDVKAWMINNQLGRRNLTDGWKMELVEGLRELLAKEGEKSQGQRTDLLSTMDKRLEPHNTQQKVATTLGWSTGKTARAEQVWKTADNETKEKIKAGDVSFNAAYNDLKKEQKQAQKQEKREAAAEVGRAVEATSDLIDLRFGDFTKVLSDIPDGSVDCIITDPPYPREFIECWSELSEFAAKKLKPNGFCVAYSGQMNLPDVINRMGEHLDYYWTFCVYHEGGGTQIVNGTNIMCRWKPILIFQNGRKKNDYVMQDYVVNPHREKDGHDWQQGIEGVKALVERFTNPMDLVVEPFAGSGTTLKACMELKRRCIGSEIDETSYNIARGAVYDTQTQ